MRDYRYVDFAMNRVRMLIYFGVTPYMVFDGDFLPSKAGTEGERSKRRDESKRLGLELLRMGKMSQAQQELQKAVDVTPTMARHLIEELKKIGVQYVVAPYEADAQLVYLERSGQIQGVLSEDSDLLVFGTKRLLTKLDQHGDCIEIIRSDFTACRDISLIGWSDADFRQMAILSGCDYLPSINKMGLKTAYRYIRKYKSIEKVLRMLQFDGQYKVPPGYLEAFYDAELTFLHQRVYCSKASSLVMLTDPGEDVKEKDMPFIGADVEQKIAMGVANGDIDPISKRPIEITLVSGKTYKTPQPVVRRKTIASQSDLKPKKPIDSFFRSNREPLAELDPNSFTPSPSQRRVLEQHQGATWSSSPAPQQTVSDRRSTRIQGATLRHFPGTQGSPTESILRTAASAPHPPKRLRLCSDEYSDTADGTVDKSRFFTSPTEGRALPKAQSGRPRKARRSQMNIWSDDSLEDAMADLPDISMDGDISTPKVKIFSDAASANHSQSQTRESFQSDSAASARTFSTSHLSQSTAATSTSGGSQESWSATDPKRPSSIPQLDQFSYKPSHGGRALEPSAGITQEDKAIQPFPALLDTRTRVRTVSPEPNCQPTSDSERLETTRSKVEATMVPLSSPPRTHDVEPDVKGSEDLIVPNSEDEGSVVSDADTDTPLRSHRKPQGINLGQFAFIPR